MCRLWFVCSPLLNSEQAPKKAQPGNEELETNRSGCSSAFLVPALITSSDFIGSLASGASTSLLLQSTVLHDVTNSNNPNVAMLPKRVDLTLVCHAGMTIKFFGLFFMQKCGLSPVTVSILSAVSPIFVSAGSIAAQSASHWCSLPSFCCSCRHHGSSHPDYILNCSVQLYGFCFGNIVGEVGNEKEDDVSFLETRLFYKSSYYILGDNERVTESWLFGVGVGRCLLRWSHARVT